jgi:hypothetical protein
MDLTFPAAAAASAVICAAAALLFSTRMRSPSRAGVTVDLALALTRADHGLRLLDAHATRSERWWEDAHSEDREAIDRALGLWDLASWYVATGRADREVLLTSYEGQVIDAWEQAVLYVEERRIQQPELWRALEDLYGEAADRPRRRTRTSLERFPLAASTYRPVARTKSVSPDVLPEFPVPVSAPPVNAPPIDALPIDAEPADLDPVDAVAIDVDPAPEPPATESRPTPQPGGAPTVLFVPERVRAVRHALVEEVEEQVRGARRPNPPAMPRGADRVIEQVIDLDSGAGVRPFD